MTQQLDLLHAAVQERAETAEAAVFRAETLQEDVTRLEKELDAYREREAAVSASAGIAEEALTQAKGVRLSPAPRLH